VRPIANSSVSWNSGLEAA
jgi:regulator of RNase E activity RraA